LLEKEYHKMLNYKKKFWPIYLHLNL